MKTIKAYIYVVVTAVLVIACKNNNPTDCVDLKIISQRDSLLSLCAKKDSSINTFISSFAEIENNLVSIRRKEQVLIRHSKKNDVELHGSDKNKINENIRIINDLTDKNRQTIMALNAKLRSANYTIGELDGLIDILVTNINHKNQDLVSLNEALRADANMLTKLNTEMIDLSGREGLERDTITNEKARQNIAYYVVGDVAQLKEDSIINEKGGFFSPYQHQEVKPGFNAKNFKKIDMNKTASIRVVSKNPKLVSTHPPDSYKIEHKFNNSQTNIVITNPAKFWSETKYLVVATD
jgi:hypothetical protein